jgi:hypothetical protein
MCETGPCREDKRWTWIPMLAESYEIEREHPDWSFERMCREVERRHPVKKSGSTRPTPQPRSGHLTIVPG